MTTSPEDDPTGERTRALWAYGGVAAGLAVGGLLTAAQVAKEGWGILPFRGVYHLLWAPCLGLILGRGLCPSRRPGRPSWRDFRLRTRALMAWVAYVALLFGVGVSTGEIGRSARVYQGRFLDASERAESYQAQAEKSDRLAQARLDAAATLRGGGVPDGLTAEQKAFLRESGPDDRGRVAETYDWLGRQQARSAEVYRALARHARAVADKYDRARRRPWLPAPPDPPAPLPPVAPGWSLR